MCSGDRARSGKYLAEMRARIELGSEKCGDRVGWGRRTVRVGMELGRRSVWQSGEVCGRDEGGDRVGAEKCVAGMRVGRELGWRSFIKFNNLMIVLYNLNYFIIYK